jgi:2-dehydro-3-deoxygluconokinase
VSDRPAPKVVGLGEALVRLSPPGHERLEQANALRVHVGGAELNALIATAALGLRAAWLTRLADNPLGRRIAAHAAMYGVHAVVDWDAGARAPLYFVEHGAPLRPTEVLYDRSATAMTALDHGGFDWAAQLSGAEAVLCSGITCALGERPAAAVRAMFEQARRMGARTVFDVNHRSRMWTWSQAAPVLRDVLQHVDVLLASGHDLARLLGRDAGEEGDHVELARRAIDGFGHAVVVLRESARTAEGRVAVTATAVTAGGEHASARHEAGVVDAFGAGDAALGAFLAGLLTDGDLSRAIDDAAWACALQHTIPGDAWQLRPSDLALRLEEARSILR